MKMPVRVYNKFLDLQIETDAYQSLQYKRSYHGVGDFELHINRYMHGAEYFQKGNIIALNKQENKTGLILTREIDLDDSGKESENFKLTGITLDGIMNRRVSVPPVDTAYDRKSGDAETVMKHYVYNHFVNPADSSRKLDMLEIAPNQNRGEHVSWESRFKNIGEELEKISIESSLGWGIFVDFNTKKLVFDCFQAKNLTQNNEFGYSPVFFSPEFETIKSQSFIDSDQDYKNVGYVGGQGEGKERKIIELGNSTGWDRIETFVDARDVGTEDEESEEELTDEEIEKQLIDRGKSKMKEMETVFSLEAEILTPITRKAYEYTHEGYLHPAQPKGRYEAKQQQVTPFQYEKDFDLGDRVQVVNKSWGLTMTAPITEFLEIHESGGFRLEGTFGESRPNLITKIQDKFNELEGIEKQEAPASVAVGKMKEALKYTDDKLTEEERKRVEQAMENLEKSMKHTEDYTYNKDAIDEKDKQVENSAKQDAADKAKEAREAAEAVAEAKAELAETQAKAHADGKIDAEEKRAIQEAKDKLEEAKMDAKNKADAAEKSAREYAELKASEAQNAAEKVAEAKAELAETQAKAHADDKITKEEKARIEQAKADLAEAKAAAELAEIEAKAYSDGKISDEEKRAIQDAKDKLEEAKAHADEADKVVEERAKKYTDSIEVGGRNLILNSDFSNGGDHWEFQKSEITDEGVLLDGYGESPHIQPLSKISKGDYVIQIWYKHLEGDLPYLWESGTKGIIKNRSPFKKGEGWQVAITEFTTEEETIFHRIRYASAAPVGHTDGKIIISKVKLEKGNKETDWTPAPEDVSKDATDKANAAQEAAEKVAEAKAQLAEEKAIANADGKITEEEKKRIKQAEENLSAAKAEAKAKADAAERAANAYAEKEDKKVKEEAAKDAKEKADQAEKNANDFSKNADNLMEGIINVGSVPIQTAYNGARIEFDGTNGFVQYDKNDNPVAWFDLDGDARFAGDITGASGTFGNVNVKDGDFTLEDDQSNVAYSITPKRNLIKDHSFESLKVGDVDLDGNEHNYTNFDVPDLPQEQMWTKSKTPKLVIQRWIAYADALPIHGDKAVLVKDANFIRQAVDDGIGGNQEYTLSAFFKQQWNLNGGIPRFEVDHMSKTGERKKRLFNKTFDRVTGYTARRLAYSFVVPNDFGVDDYLDVKISGGDDNWVQVDGVQLVEGDKPSIYEPEDSVWETIKGNYNINAKQPVLWSGTVYLSDVHEIYPDKALDDCRTGWLLGWSGYSIGSGALDSDWKYTFIPKGGAHLDGKSFRESFYRGGVNAWSRKFFYVYNDRIIGHSSSGSGDNRNYALRRIFEF